MSTEHPRVVIACKCGFGLIQEVAPAPNTDQDEQTVAALWTMMVEYNRHKGQCDKPAFTKCQVDWPWGDFTELNFKGDLVEMVGPNA